MENYLKFITRLLMISLCVVYISVSFASPTTSTNAEIPIYLKMDKYFILYTKPASPFVDQQGRLLIPLRMIEDLMGGSVDYNNTTKTATVEILGNSFELTIESKTALVNKNEIKMDTVPVLKQDSMFLPIRLFLDYTDIQYEWNSELKLLHITDKRVVVGYPFMAFLGNDITVNQDGSFHLQSFRVNGNSSLSIKAKNLTEDIIPAGKTDIQPLVMSGNEFSVDAYSKPINRPVPEIGIGETIWVNKIVGTYDGKYDYIIAVGRKMP